MRTHFHSEGAVVRNGDWKTQLYRHRFLMLGMQQRRGMFPQVVAWMIENVGPQDVAWVNNSHGDIFIKDDAAAFAFKLRWC
jgi:hypothetical protein